MSEAAATTERNWLNVAERGSVLGIRLMFAVCLFFGRSFGRAVLKPVALYYLLVHGVARRASRDYLRRVVPTVTFGLMYRHVLNFAEIVLDRVFLLRGDGARFEIHSRQGYDLIQKLYAEKRGALLIGAHIGSLDAMRVASKEKSVPINIVAYTGNARMINALLKSLNSELAGRVIEIAPGSVDSLLRVKELIDRGEMVALLADRVGLNEKNTVVDFLGSPARFPSGPFILAAALHCPVLLTFGLYTSPNRYEHFCESFVDDHVELPRGQRDAAIQKYAQQYARRLEHYCRMSPLNWFNFYDFWKTAA
jgi:predicted LPLAT superfamily acyltransferase